MPCFSQSRFLYCIQIFIMRSWYCSIQIALTSYLEIKCKYIHIILTYSTWHICMKYIYFHSFWQSFVYFEIRKYECISSIFSSVWGSEFSGLGYCCIQVYIFFTKTVIVYLCFMHKYMLVEKDMEVHEYKIFSNIALRRKLN